MDAYKASWAETKGYAINIWGIIAVNILFALLIVTIIGIPFSIYFLIMYSAAFAVFYLYLTDKVSLKVPIAPAPPENNAVPQAPVPAPPAI
jgi:hypothetical protein